LQASLTRRDAPHSPGVEGKDLRFSLVYDLARAKGSTLFYILLSS
jgi:hypothetical protein